MCLTRCTAMPYWWCGYVRTSVCEEPPVYVIPDFISRESCTELIDAAKNNILERLVYEVGWRWKHI